tara:strand:- start:3168 stop:4067 length:900 start_codon:yes stop_codon:yes gene_type:complete
MSSEEEQTYVLDADSTDHIIKFMQETPITEGSSTEEYHIKYVDKYQLYPSLEDFNAVIGYASTWRNEDGVWTSFKPSILTKNRIAKLNNIEQYLLKNIINRISVIVRHNAESILRGTLTELKEHVESQLLEGWTWENHGDVWHLDHIIPLKYYGRNDRSLLTFITVIDRFHYKNYQPLAAEDNLIKGNGNCDKLIDFINRKKLKELPRHGEGNNNAMADPSVATPAAPLAPLTVVEWIRANPPGEKEVKADYYGRYVENEGTLHINIFGKAVMRCGYESAHSGKYKYYRKVKRVARKQK